MDIRGTFFHVAIAASERGMLSMHGRSTKLILLDQGFAARISMLPGEEARFDEYFGLQHFAIFAASCKPWGYSNPVSDSLSSQYLELYKIHDSVVIHIVSPKLLNDRVLQITFRHISMIFPVLQVLLDSDIALAFAQPLKRR